jgi:hypothetical protein
VLPPLATLEALSERLGILPDAETLDGAQALAALDDASALVRSEAGKEFVDESGDVVNVPDIIVSITLASAFRAVRNPDGTTQATVGDVSVSYTREGAGGAVFLTRAEQKAVRKAAGRSGVNALVLETPHGIQEGPRPGDEWWEHD